MPAVAVIMVNAGALSFSADRSAWMQAVAKITSPQCQSPKSKWRTEKISTIRMLQLDWLTKASAQERRYSPSEAELSGEITSHEPF